MSYANMDGVPTQTAGTSELLASDWNTYVRDNFDSIKFGHVVVADATARTNLGNVAEGVMVYQSDNNKVYVNSNGTTANWVEVADLDNTGAVSDDAADYLDQYAVSSRNVIINGHMAVAQRATSKAGITSQGYYTADRWNTNPGSLGTWTQSVENDAPTGSGFRKSLKMLCTTADAAPSSGDYLLVTNPQEGQNVQHFLKGTSSAKKFAMSFWVKSNVTGTYIVELYDNDNTRQVSASYTISASGTWEKKTVVFPADTTGAFDNDNNSSLNVAFWLGAGSGFTSGTLNTSWASVTNANRVVGQVNVAAATNNYWQVTGVQLEAGDVATPFEFEPYETTLRKCQRYYYLHASGNGFAIGIGTYYQNGYMLGYVSFPTTMRSAPVSDITSGTDYYTVSVPNALDTINSLGVDQATEIGCRVTNNTQAGGTAGNAGIIATNTAAAYVAFSAEL